MFCFSDIILGFICRITVILVKRNIIHLIICLIKHLQFPLSERRHIVAGTSACHKFNIRIYQSHKLGRLTGNFPIVLRRLVSNLPRTIHLISQAPGLYAEWFFKSVLSSHISIISICFAVTVFHKISGILRTARSEIYRHNHICICAFCPLLKLIDSDFIGLNHFPRKLHFLRTFCLVTDTVFPVISGNKIASRITHSRNIKFIDQIKNILTEPHIIRRLMSGLINPSVNRTSEMFNKRTIDSFVYFTDNKLFIYCDTTLHVLLLSRI